MSGYLWAAVAPASGINGLLVRCGCEEYIGDAGVWVSVGSKKQAARNPGKLHNVTCGGIISISAFRLSFIENRRFGLMDIEIVAYCFTLTCRIRPTGSKPSKPNVSAYMADTRNSQNAEHIETSCIPPIIPLG